LGTLDQYYGFYSHSKLLRKRALEIATSLFDSKHETISRLQSNLALVLKDLGDYGGAKDLLEKALKSNEQNFGKEHPTTAVSYWILADLLKNLKDYKGAYPYAVQALDIFKKALPKNHPYIKRVSDLLSFLKSKNYKKCQKNQSYS
jgi:tetratricopeptide (TPR) repeat protein